MKDEFKFFSSAPELKYPARMRDRLAELVLTRQAERGLEWLLKQELLREECPPGGGKAQRRPITLPGAARKRRKRK